MLVEWDPEVEGEGVQSWQFDPKDVSRKQAIQIEKHYGGSFDQWIQGLRIGEINARAVLLWYMMSLAHPKYRFDDLPDFRIRQLTVQMGVNELKELWERAKRMKMPQDQWEAFVVQYEADLQDAMVREGHSADEASIIDGVLSIGAAGDELPKPQ